MINQPQNGNVGVIDEIVIWTHDGPYHADDLLAVAILSDLNPGAQIVRSREGSDNVFANYAVDIGNKFNPSAGGFDHHQKDFYLKHPEGAPLAACGLVWNAHGSEYISRQALKLARSIKDLSLDDLQAWKGLAKYVRDENVVAAVFEMVRKSFILPVDAWDNGIFPPHSAGPILHFSAIITSLSDSGRTFDSVLPFAQEALKASVTGALVKVLRSRSLKDGGKIDSFGAYVSPVRPYSMDWVLKHSPIANRGNATLAYYTDKSGLVEWVSSSRIQQKDRGRTTTAAFQNVLRGTP